MKTFSIYTLGCKVNQYESQQIRELLESRDIRPCVSADPSRASGSNEKPDLVVINTCCVTHTASAKSRQQIQRIQKHHPEAILVVCGCLPALNHSGTGPAITNNIIKAHPDASGSLPENILFVTKRDELAAILIHLINSIKPENDLKIKSKNEFLENRLYRDAIPTEIRVETHPPGGQMMDVSLSALSCFKGQTRAFLKVQDGCDGFCTYCIIPKTRPKISSKPINEALNEAKSLVQAGHKEIVITGICLGAYGRNSARRRVETHSDASLPDLIEKIARIPHLERIRLSSIEPSDITERLLDIFRTYPNVLPHIHLSLQSGSNAILKKMCRKYKVDDVRKKIEQIKTLLDRPAITTDIIAGFPGETDENFDETVKFVREAGFAKIHVFRFSSRKGTPAARMKDTIDNKIINLRSEILRELDKQSGFNFRNQFIGKNETILIESSHETRISGRSERYFMVHLKPDKNREYHFQKNDIVKVILLQNNKDGMTGEPAVSKLYRKIILSS